MRRHRKFRKFSRKTGPSLAYLSSFFAVARFVTMKRGIRVKARSISSYWNGYGRKLFKSLKPFSEIKTGIDRRDCCGRIRGISKYERFPARCSTRGSLRIKNSGGILAPLKESRNAPFSSVRETLVKSIRSAVQIDTKARHFSPSFFFYRNISISLSSPNSQ